jgi:diadenosine tetraphosphate (Ap4A) HIT family hydrolase
MKEPLNIIIWENPRFEIRIPREPHIDAHDGGHIVIYPKARVSYTYQLPKRDRKELIDLEAACEKAMLQALPADHVNIQRNGNWFFLEHPETKKGAGPHLHVHIYGRSKKSKRQPWGEGLVFQNPKTGWLKKIQPLSAIQIKKYRTRLRSILG